MQSPDQDPDAAAYYYTPNVTATLCLAVAVPLCRWVLHNNALMPAARTLLRRSQCRSKPAYTEKLQAKAEELSMQRFNSKAEKLSESLWKFLVYTGLSCMGVASIWNEPWLWDTRHYWQGWPNHPITRSAQALYYMELAWYISSAVMICCWETPRKDFAVMLSHHIITAALLATSLYCKFWRVGCVVMVLHDPNDIFMEAAKIARYCGAEDAATGIFAVFMVSWVALRLTALPLMVVRSILLELPDLMRDRQPLYYVFNGGLGLLLCLHCYWFLLMLRIAYVKLVSGKMDDIREDSDDDD